MSYKFRTGKKSSWVATKFIACVHGFHIQQSLMGWDVGSGGLLDLGTSWM